MDKVSEKNGINDLWLLYMKAQRCCFKAREKELSKYGITPEQAEMLFIINEICGGSSNAGEISRLTIREPQTVAGIIVRMAKIGLVKRSRDAKNRHFLFITLTDKGQEAYQNSKNARSTQNIISALSDKQQGQLRSILKIMIIAGKEELLKHYKPIFLR